jgi:hypothetical protein
MPLLLLHAHIQYQVFSRRYLHESDREFGCRSHRKWSIANPDQAHFYFQNSIPHHFWIMRHIFQFDHSLRLV